MHDDAHETIPLLTHDVKIVIVPKIGVFRWSALHAISRRGTISIKVGTNK